MAYSDFTLDQITRQFGLLIDETPDLYTAVGEAVLDPAFQSRLEENVKLALAISTEKARSEFIIAPILAEIRRMAGRKFGLFSGVDFPVDPANGLVGLCDYIITQSAEQLFVKAPILMLVEAKNEDMKRGYAQCVAEMIAAQRFNARDDASGRTVYGAVTTGDRWKFLEFSEGLVRIDSSDYYVDRPHKIAGILLHIVVAHPRGNIS